MAEPLLYEPTSCPFGWDESLLLEPTFYLYQMERVNIDPIFNVNLSLFCMGVQCWKTTLQCTKNKAGIQSGNVVPYL